MGEIVPPACFYFGNQEVMQTWQVFMETCSIEAVFKTCQVWGILLWEKGAGGSAIRLGRGSEI